MRNHEPHPRNRIRILTIGGALVVASLATVAIADDQGKAGKRAARAADPSAADQLIADWPARPRLAAVQMIEKYGAPTEASAHALVWREAGPYKRIKVTRQEIPHDFPSPHMDYLEHTIAYAVPADKVDELVAFDGSITVNRTAGEMSARCDLEGHNNLTHNLAHDIIEGDKTVAEARQAFAEAAVADVLGKQPEAVAKLQFEPAEGKVGFTDKPAIPGAPVRATGDAATAKGGDAETLAILIAVDLNEILAAAHATQEKVGDEVMEYARMMHTAHGKHAAATMKLGQKLKVTPLDTRKVEQLKTKGADTLATLVPLDGDEFATGYMDAMIKDHADVLAMIDGQLLEGVKNAELKRHLTGTRKTVAAHLAQAKKLRAGM